MTRKKYLTCTAALVFTVACVAIAPPAEAQRRGAGRAGSGCGGGLQALFDEIEATPLTSAEEAEVQFLREEEKLARDVYLTLAETWQLPIFTNISSAEQRHMDLVSMLMETYGVVDPITDDTVGAFTNPELDALYDQLVDEGKQSLVEALKVGTTIEDMDLADLYDLIDRVTENDHVKLVAHNLAKGSRNHLRAFVRALEAQGETFEPTYLDEETVAAILEGDVERRTIINADGEAVSACGGGRRGEGGNGGRGAGRRSGPQGSDDSPGNSGGDDSTGSRGRG